MLVYLLRHGIAVDQGPECPDDADRWLTEEGVERTRKAALGLAALGVEPSLIRRSPYRRARETAEIAAAALGVDPSRIETWEDLVPAGDPRVTLRRVREYNDRDVMLVGHNPHLSTLLAMAVGAGGREITWLKKAACACVELSSESEGPGRLVWMHPPKSLRMMGERHGS